MRNEAIPFAWTLGCISMADLEFCAKSGDLRGMLIEHNDTL